MYKIVWVAIVILGLSSCKKEKDLTPDNCRVSTIRSLQSQWVDSLIYNGDGQLTAIMQVNLCDPSENWVRLEIFYTENEITLIPKVDYEIPFTPFPFHLKLDNEKRIIEINSAYDQTFKYDSENHLIEIGYPQSQQRFEFSYRGGDITSIEQYSHDKFVLKTEYTYSKKAFYPYGPSVIEIDDIWAKWLYSEGYFGKPVKHRIIELSLAGEFLDPNYNRWGFVYEENSQGQVSKQYLLANGERVNSSYTFDYSCLY